jgi:hypothetical protein
VIRFLDREAEITTRFGGGFVQSIDGTGGQFTDGRSLDWVFFVNGIESPRGSAEVSIRGGDRIWWDYRDWTNAISTPAVVGSWPEPFLQASTPEDERLPVAIDCAGPQAPCDEVANRLDAAGIEAGGAGATGLRLLVGPWARVRSDPLAAELDRGPATSGVFARFVGDGGGWDLELLDPRGERARALGDGAGLVAGVSHRSQPPTWLVTGTDPAGVERAAELLDADDLDDRYAVAADGGTPVPAPVTEDG